MKIHAIGSEQKLSHWRRLEMTVRAQNNAVRTEVLWLNPICVARLDAEAGQMQMFEDRPNFRGVSEAPPSDILESEED